MAGMQDFKKQYQDTLDELKIIYNADYVVNYDQLPLHSYFKRLGLDFYKFLKEGERTYLDGKIKVLAIDFDFYHRWRKENKLLTGWNKCNSPVYHNNGEFYDNELNLILPIDEEQNNLLKENYKNAQQLKKDWQAFEDIKQDLYKSELGTQFKIGEGVYYYFLEVLPPIYGKNCFYCSESIKHTPEGKNVYHCLRKMGDNYTIEENIVK